MAIPINRKGILIKCLVACQLYWIATWSGQKAFVIHQILHHEWETQPTFDYTYIVYKEILK